MHEYNIEFGHIYMDQQPGSEQTQSLAILKETNSRIEKEGKTFVNTILIDDISPDSARLDIGAYTATTANNNSLDFIFLESTLGIFKEQLLSDISQTEQIYSTSDQSIRIKDARGNRIMLIKPDGSPTCSFFVAIWFLGRLGIYEDVARWGINLNNKAFAAKKIITILSEGYKSSDDQALAILEKTPYWESIHNRIESIYFSTD